ncbi:hypothetical protein Q0Z83_001350 [Actinoplanes sichuanensis]|uniref:Uncharacterized protein n=1 Tax=Actinoplanes sichuanensis TaxID=512349 RepID=A0ABW4ART6_9ACTN|nr:hypothetical protein [Actinoplanes sichuanensis]BEL01944.1 hypothetical protein Q0Z83_001350 [Actinoplanes sichuanensis]
MDQSYVELARKLRELGWWRDFSAEDAAAGERAVAEGAHPLGGLATLDEEPGERYFDVDGETMAEGGVARVLRRELGPALAGHGVELRFEELNYPDSVETGDYVIAINGRRCVVWTPADWAAGNPWYVSTVRPLAVINDLLAEAGAVSRIYTLYPGSNQGEAWLIDPRIVDVIADSGVIKAEAMPVLPGRR